MEEQRFHTVEQIRDHWLKNRGQDGSDWESALTAVYDLAAGVERKRAGHILQAQDDMWAQLAQSEVVGFFRRDLQAAQRKIASGEAPNPYWDPEAPVTA